MNCSIVHIGHKPLNTGLITLVYFTKFLTTKLLTLNKPDFQNCFPQLWNFPMIINMIIDSIIIIIIINNFIFLCLWTNEKAVLFCVTTLLPWIFWRLQRSNFEVPPLGCTMTHPPGMEPQWPHKARHPHRTQDHSRYDARPKFRVFSRTKVSM